MTRSRSDAWVTGTLTCRAWSLASCDGLLKIVKTSHLYILGQISDTPLSLGIDPAEDDALYPGLGSQQNLSVHERGCGHHMGNFFHALHHGVVVRHVVPGSLVDDDVGSRAQDFGLQILLEPGHDAQRPNQGGHSQGDACD